MILKASVSNFGVLIPEYGTHVIGNAGTYVIQYYL